MIFDGLLIILCIATAGYCHYLARQIKRLQDAKHGIAQAIRDMSGGVDEMENAFKRTRSGIDVETERLREMIEEGSALSEYIEMREKRLSDLLNDIQARSERLESARKMQMNFTPEPRSHYFDDERVMNERAASAPSYPAPAQSFPENDPLDEVVPKGFRANVQNRVIKNRYKMPGEEYL